VRMDMHNRDELTRVVAKRYRNATKKEKGVILQEFCLNTGYEHKYAIKKLRRMVLYSGAKKQKQQRKKQSKYMKITATIKGLWDVADFPSATRLYAIMPELVKRGIAYEEIHPTNEQQELLQCISISSIDRMLQSEIRTRRRRINGQTKAGKLKYEIPLAIDSEPVTKPGVLEIDLVVHCGESAMGEFINTLNATDSVTGWYEAEAIMGKSQRAVEQAMEEIEKRLPYPLTGIDSDNGTEFINGNMKRYAQRRQITFTRSRPYKKNDNAHIEQKNFTHVRKIIGYARFDTKEQQEMMNALYRNELRLYINFFQPSQKLIKKERIGSKIKRIYDKPKTPYQRVMESEDIAGEVKQRLTEQYERLNPFALKRAIDKKIRLLFQSITITA
jgi:hypothetical protein